MLKGNGRGVFYALPPVSTGLILDGDVKDFKVVTADGQRILLAAINDAAMKAFVIKKK
jgi:hypothetical protein